MGGNTLDRYRIIEKTKIKLSSKTKFLDWVTPLLEKFQLKVPSLQEAKKFLSQINKEDVEAAYKKLPLLHKDPLEKTSLDLKNTLKILIALSVLGGGVLPSTPAKACESMDGCSIQRREFKVFQDFRNKEISGTVLDTDTFDQAKKKLVGLAKNLGTSEKDLSGTIKIYADEEATKELKTVKDILSSEWVYLGH